MSKIKVFAIVITLLILPTVSASAEPEVFWSYKTGGAVTGVAISDDGNYTAAASSDGYLYLLNKSKELSWKVKTEITPLKVAISSDGSKIYVGDESNVYLYNGTGDLQWEFRAGDEIVDLAVTPRGDRVVVGAVDRNIYLLNAVGGILWKYPANAPVFSVAISGDGKYIAAGTSGSITYMLLRDGNLLWEYISTKSVDGVGILGTRVVSGERYLTFLEDGNKVGSYSDTVCDITGIETTAGGEYALVGCGDGEVYLVDRAKKKHWSYDVGKTSLDSSISSSGDFAVLAGADTVYILKSPDIAPPIVEITNPADREGISGVVEIDAEVLEDSSYTVRVLIDGDYACSELPCSWNTGTATEGEHKVTVEIEDSGENKGRDSVNVTIMHTLLGELASELSETQKIVEDKQETLKETEEAIKETLDAGLSETLPPIRKDKDYSLLVKGVALILAVYAALKILRLLRPKRRKARRKKYKFKR